MDSKRFEATLARANQLGVQAIETREQAVDTGLLLHLSDIGVNMARNLDPGGAGRTPGDLVAALVSAFVPALDAADSVRENPALFDWAELGLRVAHVELEVLVVRVARRHRPARVPREAALVRGALVPRAAPGEARGAQLGARDVGRREVAAIDAVAITDCQ